MSVYSYLFHNQKKHALSKLKPEFCVLNNHIFFFYNNKSVFDIIKYAKYGKKPASFLYLGNIIGEILVSKKMPVDIVAYVPMHKKDEYQRGFNQSKILAECISKHTGVLVCENALHKVKRTSRQAALSASMRKYNLLEAFQADSVCVKEKRILLVDDIYTTGSTLNVCKQVLMDAGADAVIFLTVLKGEEKDIFCK